MCIRLAGGKGGRTYSSGSSLILGGGLVSQKEDSVGRESQEWQNPLKRPSTPCHSWPAGDSPFFPPDPGELGRSLLARSWEVCWGPS